MRGPEILIPPIPAGLTFLGIPCSHWIIEQHITFHSALKLFFLSGETQKQINPPLNDSFCNRGMKIFVIWKVHTVLVSYSIFFIGKVTMDIILMGKSQFSSLNGLTQDQRVSHGKPWCCTNILATTSLQSLDNIRTVINSPHNNHQHDDTVWPGPSTANEVWEHND